MLSLDPMGVFNTICTLLSIIGKRFQDAGHGDLCIESGVIAKGSVGRVLDGPKYNRAVRFHKLLYAALLRLAYMGLILQEEYDTEANCALQSMIGEFLLV